VFTRLLVPLDGSELAEEVLPHVEHLASSLSLNIELVRVSRLASTSTPYSATLLASDHVDVDAGVEGEAVKYLDEIGDGLKSSGFTVDSRVVRGAPVEDVVSQGAMSSPKALDYFVEMAKGTGPTRV